MISEVSNMCGQPATNSGLRSMGLRWLFVLGLILAAVSGCSLQYRKEQPLPLAIAAVGKSAPSELEQRAWLSECCPLIGEVPAGRVRSILLIKGYPSNLIQVVPPLEAGTWEQSLEVLARANKLEVSGKDFVAASASHSVESPDAAGRPGDGFSMLPRRRLVRVRVRFRVVGVEGGIDTSAPSAAQLAGSGQSIEFGAVIAAGVNSTWSSTTERSYTQGAVSVDSGQVVKTTKTTVPAGVQYSGIVGFVTGSESMRIDSVLSVSAFLGDGIERSSVSVPLQVDVKRGAWVEFWEFDTMDARVRAAFMPLGLKMSGGSTKVRVALLLDSVG